MANKVQPGIIVESFMRIAHETPQKTIVVDSEGSYTCGQLNLYSSKVAHWLIAQGIRQGSVIGILTPRCKEYAALGFGILKAGCAIVTLEEDYPEERREIIIKQADARMVLTVDTLKEILDSDTDDSDICLCDINSTFQIFFTSGSTGKPKGVVKPLAELTYYLNNAVKNELFTSGDISANVVRFSFVAILFALWLPIGYGIPVHVIKQDTISNPASLCDYLKDHHITFSIMTTSYGAMLLNDYNPSLKNVILLGERIQPICNDKVRVLNVYASTEMTWVTSGVIHPGDTHLTAGTPMAGTQVYILDGNQNLLPQGAAGEICISSVSLSSRYLDDPDLNAEKYVCNPFIPGRMMFRSGDLGYFDENGELVVTGRLDNMVKLRGYRVELDGIAHIAARCSGIDKCVCTKIEKGGSQFLCCYYTSAAGTSEEVLKAHLARELPPYMVPDIYMILDRIPLNLNGKIDRKSLPEPEFKTENAVLPATEEERQVLEIVQEMMGLSPVSVTASLISLGLTSIAAMRLAMRLSKELGRSITMPQLMSAPNVRDIAANLSAQVDPGLGQVRWKQEYYPLTDNQLGVYLDWERHREGLQYNTPYVLKLKGGAGPEQCRRNANRLKTAVETIVSAHTYLKSRLSVIDGEVLLQRRDEDHYECTVTCIPDGGLSKGFFQSRVLPFDLFKGPLSRFEMFTCGDEIYLFLDIHHIITDGLSEGRLIAEIFKAYNGEAIEPETFTAFDRALEEQEIKQSDTYSQAKDYYNGLLAGLESTSYPHSTSGLGSGKAGRVRQSLCKTAIEEHCARLGVTASSYLLTVFMEVLKRITREEKVLITTVNSGREHAAMQDIQGFFAKTLPVISADTAAEVQSQLAHSISHECYPLTQMVQSPGIRPEILYAYEGGLFEDVIAPQQNEMEIIPLSIDTAKVPLALTAGPDGEDFNLSIEYDDSLYNEADMRTLLHCIVTLARNYAGADAESENVSLQECPMLTEDEEQRLIALGTGEKLDYDKSKTFIDLFREQAVKTPAAVAVVDKNSQMTYKELDEASDEYAKTVAPGTFVCLELPRVKEFVVAVLGIWKAGSAYVPVDTGYPEDRKMFMRQECDGHALPQPDIAYMIYTSGSTGRPKGVMNTHSGLLNFIHWNNRAFPQHAGTHHIVHSSFSFDATLFDIFCPLAAGATAHIVDEILRHDLDGLASYIRKNRITGMLMTPQVGAGLLLQDDLPLAYLIFGGDRMPKVPAGGIKLYNAYGPTEFTSCSSFYEVKDSQCDNIPIGRSVPNTSAFICDVSGHLLPQGVTGELYLAGPQLALGYYNNPELTDERFVDVTICGRTFKIFKTGDLCRWNADGLLEYIGRIDNQVKLRGFRIELGEIESAALQIEGIRQAVAIVKDGRIVLYYTGDASLDASSFASLPEYMVPSCYVRLEAMPLSPNGKIERKALPEPEYVQEEYIAPQSRIEKLLCKIIENELGLEHIGITDSLRSCGMSSIQAMRLNMQMHTSGLHVTPGIIMKADNVRNLCQCINDGIDHSDVGSWLEGYDTAKPAIVLCCGVNSAEKITRHLPGFKYNIYVLEPIFDAWSDVEELSHEDIVSRYLAEMMQDIHCNISCIMGFSYGGELAYQLAARWNAQTGQKPLVLMGDTVITDKNLLQPVYENEMDAYYYGLQSEFFSKRKRLFVPDYPGPVILISAGKEAPYRSANEQEWKARNTHINIVPVNDTHRGLFLNAEHYDQYLSLIGELPAQKDQDR